MRTHTYIYICTFIITIITKIVKIARVIVITSARIVCVSFPVFLRLAVPLQIAFWTSNAFRNKLSSSHLTFSSPGGSRIRPVVLSDGGGQKRCQ